MSNRLGFHGVELACDHCGSNLGGYICSCGEMRCICQDGKPCETCQDREDEGDRQAKQDNEAEDRRNFEVEMREKYG